MLHKIALLQRVKEAVAADDPEYPELAELAALLSPEEVQLYYQIALTGRNRSGTGARRVCGLYDGAAAHAGL